jgi:transposase
MNIRIRMSRETVKELMNALQKAYKSGDAAMVRRVAVLLDVSRGDRPDAIATKHGVSVASVYAWLKALLSEGLASLKPRWRGGRPRKLTASQRQQVSQWLKAGPQAAGYPCGCWSALLVQDLIQREFGVLYNAHYLCQLLKTLGFSYQKARFVSDHLDEVKRLVWLTQVFPEFKRQAQAAGGLLLFGDEASFAQWGSLAYTWAPVGQQPAVPTSGKRRGYKVFGLIEFFSGWLFYQGIEGRFNAASYILFLTALLHRTTQPLFLVQDGAKYHTAHAVQLFFAAHRDRLTAVRLPSYSPDYNPIEFLWRAIKRRTTHNVYFPEFTRLVTSVEDALAYLQTQPEYVKSLFTLYLDEMAQSTLSPELVA